MIKKWLIGISFVFTQILAFLLGVSCQAAPPSAYMGLAIYNIAINGKVMDSSTSNAIEGIRVSLLQNNATVQTNTSQINGEYSFVINYGTQPPNPVNQSYTIEADDIDGTNNGSYNSTSTNINIDTSSIISTNIDIYMKTN
jgi:putative lipoprotein (rSAM/lipoprotein system)